MTLRIRLCLCLLFVAITVKAETYQGKVVGVTDGDTIVVLDDAKVLHKVRLAGIDAPEKGQPYGDVSKQNLAKLVFQKTVTVEAHKRDRYKREVGMVLVGPTDSNLEQVKAGLAWHYKRYQAEQSPEDREAYARAEENARERRVGLWKNSSSVPPWEFRKAKQ